MLSEKQKQFCDYYLTTLNATEAARLAGYESVNPEAMRVKAYRLIGYENRILNAEDFNNDK